MFRSFPLVQPEIFKSTFRVVKVKRENMLGPNRLSAKAIVCCTLALPVVMCTSEIKAVSYSFIWYAIMTVFGLLGFMRAAA